MVMGGLIPLSLLTCLVFVWLTHGTLPTTDHIAGAAYWIPAAGCGSGSIGCGSGERGIRFGEGVPKAYGGLRREESRNRGAQPGL